MFLLCIFPKGNNQIDSGWGLSLMLYTSPAAQNNNNNNTTSRLYDYDVCAQFKRHKSYQLFCSNRKKQDFVVSFSSFLSFFLFTVFSSSVGFFSSWIDTKTPPPKRRILSSNRSGGAGCNVWETPSVCYCPSHRTEVPSVGRRQSNRSHRFSLLNSLSLVSNFQTFS